MMTLCTVTFTEDIRDPLTVQRFICGYMCIPSQLEDTPEKQSGSCFESREVIPYISPKKTRFTKHKSFHHVPPHRP